MILKLLNQGATHENYRTLVIAASFYSNERGEEDKGKLLSNAVKESRDCIRFNVCSTVSGEMVESITQTCTLRELVEEDDFNTIVSQSNTKKAGLMLKNNAVKLESIHTGNGFLCISINHTV